MIRKLLHLPTTWLGIIIIVAAFAILIRQPIPASKWYWVEIWNYVTALLITIPASLSIAWGIARIIKNERQYMEQTSDKT